MPMGLLTDNRAQCAQMSAYLISMLPKPPYHCIHNGLSRLKRPTHGLLLIFMLSSSDNMKYPYGQSLCGG